MAKIYLYCLAMNSGSGIVHGSTVGGDVVGFALAEDGNLLATHCSSSPDFSKHDMGLTSDWKHDDYNEHYPDGYEVEWIDEPNLDNHAGFQDAFAKNQAIKEAE